MQLAEATRICASLKCENCQQQPTAAEVDEMIANFGHKLDDSDVGATLKAGGSCLTWFCLDCSSRPQTLAEKRAMRARRWAEWKAAQLAQGTTQQAIDELEISYEKMWQSTFLN